MNRTSLEDLENAYSASTVAIFWFQGAMNQPSELSLADVIQSAKKQGVPVIVDGAAQLPPAQQSLELHSVRGRSGYFQRWQGLVRPTSIRTSSWKVGMD